MGPLCCSGTSLWQASAGEYGIGPFGTTPADSGRADKSFGRGIDRGIVGSDTGIPLQRSGCRWVIEVDHECVPGTLADTREWDGGDTG